MLWPLLQKLQIVLQQPYYSTTQFVSRIKHSQNQELGALEIIDAFINFLKIQTKMLTQTQKTQLHKDLLEYLVNNNFAQTSQAFAEEADLSLADVDSEGTKLIIKWKSILSLQKKITNLEQKVQSLQEQLAKAGSAGGKPSANLKIQDLYIPKVPAKFEMKGHKSPITNMAFHPQYTQLATSSEDGTIKIWQVETGQFQRTLKGHTNPVNCVNYDSNGKFLVSCSSDLTIKLWDLNNDFQCCKTFYGHQHNISHVDFVLGGDFLISASRDKTIRLWEISTGYCKKTFAGHEGWVRKIASSVDGKTFASCSDDQSVILWNFQKQSPLFRFFAHENVIQNIMIIQGEHSSLLMNAEFLKHKFSQQAKINALKQLQKQGTNGIASYQQTFILTSSRDKLIRLFIAQTGELLYSFVGHDNWVRGLAIHPTGKYIYTASDDKTLRVWDLNFGKQKKKIEAHDHFISTVRFHSKYGVIATAGNDMVVKIWNLK